MNVLCECERVASRVWVFSIMVLLPIGCSGDSSHETKDGKGRVIEKVMKVAPFKQVNGPFGTITALAFSSDGRCLLSGAGPFMPGVQVFPIREWDVSTMREVTKLEGHKRGITCLDVAIKSPLLASASWDKTVRVWDLVQNHEVARLRVPAAYDTASVSCLKFAPDEDTLILGGGEGDGSITVWDWKQTRILKKVQCEGWIQCLSVSKDGKHVVAGGWHGTPAERRPFAALIDLSTGEVIRRFAGDGRAISAMALAPDGRTLLTGDTRGSLDCYDLHDGRHLKSLTGHSKAVAGIAFLGSEDAAITAGSDGRIIRWDVKNGREQWSLDTGQCLVSMAVSPSEDLLAVGTREGWIRIWKLSELNEKLGNIHIQGSEK